MIRDKNIFIKNIYYMLSYAFSILEQSVFENVEKEAFENIHNLFAAILSKGIGQQLKQGLYREYLNKVEDVAVMRGKIDMPGTVKKRISRRRLLTCDYDELSENNLLNQILKTTAMILLRHDNVDTEYKDNLKKEMLFFSHVDVIDPLSISWTTIRFQRNNRTYRLLTSICQLVIEGMLLTTEEGHYKLASFIDEQAMSRLYEKFIYEYYSQTFPDLHVNASEIKWVLDDGIGTMLPSMQTDVTITHGNNILIIDAKYYQKITQASYDIHKIRSNNLYQIFAYVKNKSADYKYASYQIAGMLLYAKTDAAIQPDNSYLMSGNKISVRTLDLNTEFDAIKAQLNGIVGEHFGIY